MEDWKSVDASQLENELNKLYGIYRYRIGTDYFQILHVIPENMAFGENAEEIGNGMNIAQTLMLCKSIYYSEDINIWQNNIDTDVVDFPFVEEDNQNEILLEEHLRDSIDENTYLKQQVTDLEERVIAYMKKNTMLEDKISKLRNRPEKKIELAPPPVRKN